MKILVPMAGADRHFKSDDYPFPKPLVDIAGRPMLEWVVENLKTISADAEFIFICRDEHVHRYGLEQIFSHLTSGRSQVISLKQDTSGAICSCLLAAGIIDEDSPLVIANGDQIIEGGLADFHDWAESEELDAAVLTFESIHPRWSYVSLDPNDNVTEAAEKRVISRNATAGVYYFKTGATFLNIAYRSMLEDNSVDKQFFIAPALNYLVLDGSKVAARRIDSNKYHSFFAPYKVEEFESKLRQREIHFLADRAAGVGAPAKLQPTIVIPAAGEGSRFAKAGYARPKPFIDVNGAPMISRVLDNLSYPNANYVLLLREEHIDQNSDVAEQIRASYQSTIVPVKQLTEGTACTVMLARKKIDPDAPLIIANSDQIVDFDFTKFVDDCIDRDLDGSVLVFRDVERSPKWSFAKLGANDLITEVKEKQAISDLATVGIYMFRRARDFFDAVVDMISLNERVNNEFYTCPVYNYAIANGLRIGVMEVSPNDMHGIGTPEDLNAYLALIAKSGG